MKYFTIILLAALMLAAVPAGAPAQDVYNVWFEDTCFVACPSGDLFFCACITKNDLPLTLHYSQVFMKIECLEGCIEVCAGECLDKCAYLRQDVCEADPGNTGAEYCWMFRIGGCCPSTRISMHLKNETTPFYTLDTGIKTLDFDCNGVVDDADQSILTSKMGTGDFCCDLNCDGTVDIADSQIFDLHNGHSCENWIKGQESTWGGIKTIYKE